MEFSGVEAADKRALGGAGAPSGIADEAAVYRRLAFVAARAEAHRLALYDASRPAVSSAQGRNS